MVLAPVSSFIRWRKYKHVLPKVAVMKRLPLPPGTRWDMMAPKWQSLNSCGRAPGMVFHHILPDSKGRIQLSEFAPYFPCDSAASPRAETLDKQRELGLWATTLALVDISCIALSCLTPS